MVFPHLVHTANEITHVFRINRVKRSWPRDVMTKVGANDQTSIYNFAISGSCSLSAFHIHGPLALCGLSLLSGALMYAPNSRYHWIATARAGSKLPVEMPQVEIDLPKTKPGAVSAPATRWR